MTVALEAVPMVKSGRDRSGSKTVRISSEAYEAARRFVKLSDLDLGEYISKLVLTHAPKDFKAAIRKLSQDEE